MLLVRPRWNDYALHVPTLARLVAPEAIVHYALDTSSDHGLHGSERPALSCCSMVSSTHAQPGNQDILNTTRSMISFESWTPSFAVVR